MTIYPKTGLLTACLLLSMLAHILLLYGWRLFGTYNFSAPVNQPQSVVVDIAKRSDTISPELKAVKREVRDSDHFSKDNKTDNNRDSTVENDSRHILSNLEQNQPNPKPADTAFKGAGKNLFSALKSDASSIKLPEDIHHSVTAVPGRTRLSTVGEFLLDKNEKLTYLISMFGLPVGSAELEAKHKRRGILFTLRVKSNDLISNIFPVNNIVETNLRGRFISTRIKQQEGSFKSDEGFTIDPIRQKVSWFDNIAGRNFTKTIPTAEVLDSLSGIYSIRNRQLEIGKTEMLHIFDSETYAEVPVEILRRETVILPNFTKVDTLVVQPLQKTAGIFRRTGDILIWMTDDAYKVPVRIETSVALGKVTIELLSAESTPLEEEDEESE